MTDFGCSPTFRLYDVPSFWDGMAMALDYAHTMPEFDTDPDPLVADDKAIAADWLAVRNNFASAMSSQMR